VRTQQIVISARLLDLVQRNIGSLRQWSNGGGARVDGVDGGSHQVWRQAVVLGGEQAVKVDGLVVVHPWSVLSSTSILHEWGEGTVLGPSDEQLLVQSILTTVSANITTIGNVKTFKNEALRTNEH
jgi:hypothetical protein